MLSPCAAGSHAYIHFNLWADREKSFLAIPEASQRALGRKTGVPGRREGCLLLKESILHQADAYLGGSFPIWMLCPSLPTALDSHVMGHFGVLAVPRSSWPHAFPQH